MLKSAKVTYLLLCLLYVSISFGQLGEVPTKRKSNFVVLPATAYTPETGFTIGVLGDYFFDFAKGDLNARMSKVSLTAIYTTKKQWYFVGEWNLFTPNEKWIYEGKIKYARFSERHYGLGNEADALTKEYYFDRENVGGEMQNFLNYRFDFLTLIGTANRKIRPNLYLGLQFDFEKTYNYVPLPDSFVLFNNEIDPKRIEGLRTGLGFKVLYDTRKNINNPLKGTYVQFKNWFYNKALGGDFNYSVFVLDFRKYINTVKDQTFAFRIVAEHRLSNHPEKIPLRGLSFVGGKDFIRGYFEGTYRDVNMLAFESEYRLPLGLDYNAPMWKFWKRMGVVFFFSGAKVFEEWKDVDYYGFRFAAGGGLRYMFSTDQKVNLRIDYGVGLDPFSGYNKFQSGLYFFLSEAF